MCRSPPRPSLLSLSQSLSLSPSSAALPPRGGPGGGVAAVGPKVLRDARRCGFEHGSRLTPAGLEPPALLPATLALRVLFFPFRGCRLWPLGLASAQDASDGAVTYVLADSSSWGTAGFNGLPEMRRFPRRSSFMERMCSSRHSRCSSFRNRA